MKTVEVTEKRFDPVALLVDGENISTVWAQTLLTEARLFGVPTVRRVYGKSEHIAGWEQNGFKLVPTRPGKNAADLLLCVEASTFALRDSFHTLIIASSDGDFSYLAEHLRELGHEVIGVGESKTPRAFREVCTAFIELRQAAASAGQVWPATKIIPKVRDILCFSSLDGNWGTAAFIGVHLRRTDPSFVATDYGHKTLEALLEGTGYFETKRSPEKVLMVKDPNPKQSKVAPASA